MHDPFSPRFDFMFTLVPIVILIGAIAIFAMIAYGIAGNIRNSRAPRQTVHARVAAKRMEVRGDTFTNYYITLEFENGERREFLDVKKLYGLVVEGDVGYAAIQGDWIVAFERQPAPVPKRGSGW